MKKDEVWRVRFPIVPGRTQSGLRPAVILTDDQFIGPLKTVLVVPFTSQQATMRFPGTLLIQPDGTNGLTVPSVALVFQLTTVDRVNCLQRLGVLDAQSVDQVLAQFDRLTGR